MNVTKEQRNGKYTYHFNGKVIRTSTKEFKYACIATTRQSKGATSEGNQFVLSFGNNYQSTRNSMARYYQHCDLDVVEIR